MSIQSTGAERAPRRIGYAKRLTLAMLAAALVVMLMVAVSPGSTSDTTADRVLGQIDFYHNGENNVGASGMTLPGSVAVDGAGHIYVTDLLNNRVLGWQSAASFSSGAPADIVIGQPDFQSYGCNDGKDSADVNGLGPDSMCLSSSIGDYTSGGVGVDRVGDLYVADTDNSRVLEYNAPFSSCTSLPCAGLSANAVFGQNGSFITSGCNDGKDPADKSGLGADSLCHPEGVAADPSGNLYISDTLQSRVLEYNTPLASSPPNATANVVFGTCGSFTGSACTGTYTENAATLAHPNGVALDSASNLYIADTDENRVVEYNAPLASNPPNTTANVVFGTCGDLKGNGCTGSETGSSLGSPSGVAVDGAGNVYIADPTLNRVLEYNTPLKTNPPNTTADMVFGQNGSFTTSTCNGGTAAADENAVGPDSLCLTTASSPYTGEPFGGILPPIVPLLGTPGGGLPSGFGYLGTLVGASAVAVDGAGNLYIADAVNNRVLEYNTPVASGNTSANRVLGQTDLVHNGMNNLDGASLQIDVTGFDGELGSVPPDTFQVPGITVDGAGHVYVADSNNSRVLGWKNATSFANGQTADLVIGQPDFQSWRCNRNSNLGAPAADTLCWPEGLAADGSNDLFIADTVNSRVVEYNAPFAGCATFPCVASAADAVFGQNGSFTTNDCGTTQRGLCYPEAATLDNASNLYVADAGNNRVLEYNKPLSSSPPGTTANLVFGQDGSFTQNGCNDGTASGDSGGVGPDSLCNPLGVAIDGAGNLYIADTNNNRALEYNTPLNASSGETGAGDTTADIVFGQNGSFESRGSFPPGPDSLFGPSGVAIDSSGNLYLADAGYDRVLEYDTPLKSNPPNTSADLVFGQNGSFTGFLCNDGTASGDVSGLGPGECRKFRVCEPYKGGP